MVGSRPGGGGSMMYCAGCGIPWRDSPCRRCGGNAPCRCSRASAKAIRQSYAVLNSNPPSGGPEFDAEETNDLLFSVSPPADYRISWPRSIPGVGPVISAKLQAHIEIAKLKTVRDLWRYAGLIPGPGEEA